MAADLAERAHTFQQVFGTSQSNNSRCPATIDAKNIAMDEALALARTIIGHIRVNPAISVSIKYELGFREARPRRASIPAPTIEPLLSIDLGPDGEHIIRFADLASGGRRSKPRDARSLELRTIIHARKTAIHRDDVAGATLVRDTRHTRKLITIDYATEPLPGIEDVAKLIGQYATYFGRWMTAANKPGPWTISPLCLSIVGRAMRLNPGEGQDGSGS